MLIKLNFPLSIFSIFLILSIAQYTKSAFCQFLLKDYFNLETINYVSTTHILDNQNQIYPTLCHDFASPSVCSDPGNLFLLKRQGNTIKCTSLSNCRRGTGRRYQWDRVRIPGVELWSHPEKFSELVKKHGDYLYLLEVLDDKKKIDNYFRLSSEEGKVRKLEQSGEMTEQLENKPTDGSMVFNTTISLTTKIVDQDTIDLGIKTISYILICPKVFKTQQSQYKSFLTKEKNLLFIYKGNKACGYNTIEASVFIKRHKSFALLIIFSALFTFATLVPLQNYPVLWRLNHPNMPISGSTFSLSILTGISFLSNFEHYFPMSYSSSKMTLAVFYICVITQSLLLGIMSFYSPMSVAPLHSISIALVLSYLSSTVYLLISGNGVTQTTFHITIVTLSLLSVAGLSFLNLGLGADKLTGKKRIKSYRNNNKRSTAIQLRNVEGLLPDTERESEIELNLKLSSDSIKKILIKKKGTYTLGPLIVGFCTPFYLFYGLGCYFSWWPELITRSIEQSYGINLGGEREDWWAWWGLLGIMCMQVVGVFAGLDLLE